LKGIFTEISELSEGKTREVLKEIIKEEKNHMRMISELME
jgi:rubrerythrin